MKENNIKTPETTDDEKEWLRAAATNPAFDFLKDLEEDIYTINDGKPFCDDSEGGNLQKNRQTSL